VRIEFGIPLDPTAIKAERANSTVRMSGTGCGVWSLTQMQFVDGSRLVKQNWLMI